MRKYIWALVIILAVGATTYSQGLEKGYKTGYNTAMADTVLGLADPEQYVKGLVNAESNRDDRAAD